jgi:pimeloyl-ACP methyl ester carboxylesterase
MEDRDVIHLQVKGIKTRYIKKGKGPNLLLVPGWRCDIERIHGLIDFFSDYFTTYCVDFPGHGGTEPLKEKHTLKRLAVFTKDWLDAIQLKEFHIAGFSMGGPISVHLLDIVQSFGNVYLIAPWTSQDTLKMNKLSLGIVEKTTTVASGSRMLCRVGEKTFKSPRLLKFVIGSVERKSKHSSQDLNFFANSWGRFSFKVCMETMSDIFDTDIRRLPKKFGNEAFLITSRNDPYIDFYKTYNGYRKIFPKIRPIFLKHKFHAPRSDITKKFCTDHFGEIMETVNR